MKKIKVRKSNSSNKNIFLLSLFVIFTIGLFILINKTNRISLTSNTKASTRHNSSICPINLWTMRTDKDCCDSLDKRNGYRCYTTLFSSAQINCNTRQVTKCKDRDCNFDTGRCLVTITPVPSSTPVPSPIHHVNILSDDIQACNLSGNTEAEGNTVVWIKECCPNNTANATDKYKCVFSQYDVENENDIKHSLNDSYLNSYVLNCEQKEYYECKGSCVPDQKNKQNKDVLKCEGGIQAGPYRIEGPKEKVSADMTINEKQYILNVKDGERYFIFKINLNPDKKTCNRTLKFLDIKKSGMRIAYSTIIPEYKNNYLYIKVIDTAYMDYSYVPQSKEVFKSEPLLASNFWSIKETNYDFFRGVDCIQK